MINQYAEDCTNALNNSVLLCNHNDDELFKDAVFGSQIIINKEPTKPPNGKIGWVHYNMENSSVAGREVWDVKKLLEVGNRQYIHFILFCESFRTVKI